MKLMVQLMQETVYPDTVIRFRDVNEDAWDGMMEACADELEQT